MPTEKVLVLCYNSGCGQRFDPNENKEDSCVFHSGQPVFHDAYKGWSCCNKKCTDFTEFLNIKGCTRSYHNSVKPPEPEKPVVDKSKADEVIEVRAPVPQAMERPSFDSPLISLQADIAPLLKQQLETLKKSDVVQTENNSSEVSVGTSCKNGGCKATYEGLHSLDESCTFHPGVPIFHEGLKFWSCCTKRTSDFNAFLDQVGCNVGKHIWHKKETGKTGVKCRYDWHQTGSHVVVSVFAKKYDPIKSFIKLNPVRLVLHLFFPETNDAFDLDIELRGIVDVSASSASMMGTKVEIKLRKAEVVSWSKLDFPRASSNASKQDSQAACLDTDNKTLESRVDAVDLSDL